MPTTYAIPDGRVAMAATTYTGNSGTQSISNAVNGISFQPDFVWVKSRSSGTGNHLLEDVNRGVKNSLISNDTSAELARGINAFLSNGFSFNDTGGGDGNVTGQTYVGWQWKAGGTPASNTAGSITSSVSANTTAGFSVVTYTGNGISGATVGHGLGVTPGMTITKIRSTTGYWSVWHNKLTSYAYELYLNTTDAQQLDNSYTATPSSTVITMNNGAINNSSGATYVTYCFAPVAGYSAFGSYTGNGSTDGPFVYTSMRPRFIMVKRTDSTSNWYAYDSSRNTANPESLALYPNASYTEDTEIYVDFLSNGFKCRSSTVANISGATYIYMVFAENPTKFANAR